MKVKQALDELFGKVVFDTKLYKKLVRNNIEFITRNEEHKQLFGGRLIGCYLLKYTVYDKNIFYSNLLGTDFSEVTDKIEEITTINKSFKIARDDINLVCFYMAHRFLTNTDLSEDKRTEYAKEVLNYFSYRTLVLISSNYFVYPVSEELALSLTERLSNRYVIKRLKNWNEYCQYRSEEYLNPKNIELLTKFTNDEDIPNAITDLYNRTKDTLKNIYVEFMDMLENDNVIKSKKSLVNDIEGEEVIIDKVNSADTYLIKIESLMTDKSSFIKKDFVNVCTDIVNTVSYKQLEETLSLMIEYAFKDRDSNVKIKSFFNDILTNTIQYLQANNQSLSSKNDVIKIINAIVGNILYARGNDIAINQIKETGDKLIKQVYKANRRFITDRNIRNIRNAVYVYVVVLALLA